MDNCLLEVYGGLASRHRERRKAAHAFMGGGRRATFFSSSNRDDDDDEDEQEEDEDDDGPPKESDIGIRPAVDTIPPEEVGKRGRKEDNTEVTLRIMRTAEVVVY